MILSFKKKQKTKNIIGMGWAGHTLHLHKDESSKEAAYCNLKFIKGRRRLFISVEKKT